MQTMKYNKLAYEVTQDMRVACLMDNMGRCTGKTTFEILSLIGALHKSPGEWVNISDYISDFEVYGYHHKLYVRDMILQIINKLGLKFIECSRHRNQIRYSLYGKIEWKVVD